MKKIFGTNGIPFWDQRDIETRQNFKSVFARDILDILASQNTAWRLHVHEIEGPTILPDVLLNPNYTSEDVWSFNDTEDEDGLVMRPETTASSYAYAHYLMDHGMVTPPFIVWQAGKSYRREQDQVSKNMRLKEFYQQEFQCFYAADTMNDYQSAIMDDLKEMFSKEIGLPARVVESDRLPSYSEKTMDVEVDNGDKWMEICSVSVRNDFTRLAEFKNGKIKKQLKVLEIAIGLDRCVYNRNQV